MNPPNRSGFSLNSLSTKAKVGIGCGGFFALMFITASCAAIVDTLANGAPEEEPAVAEATQSPEPEPEAPVEEETEEAPEPQSSLVEDVEAQAVVTLGPGEDGEREPREWWDLVTGWEEGEPGEILVNTSLPYDSPYVNGEDGQTSYDVAYEICAAVANLKAFDLEDIERVSVRDESEVGIRGCEPLL